MPLYKIDHQNIKKFCLFVHIPKTGGTSITSFFKLLNFKETYGYDVDFRELLKETPQHFTYNTLNNLINISRIDFSFAIMRDPFDKIISSYFWSKKYSNQSMDIKKKNFENWFSTYANLYKENKNVLANHLIPQHEFLGKKLKKIYKFEDGVNIIFSDVIKSLNLKINDHYYFPHLLKNQKNNKKEIKRIKESKQISKIIFDFYKKDYELYEKIF